MSMNKYTCLLLGVQIQSDNRDVLEKYWNYLELEKDIPVELVYGEGSKYYYLGRILETSEPYSAGLDSNIDFGYIDTVERTQTRNEILSYYGLDVDIDDIKLWFFDYWS